MSALPLLTVLKFGITPAMRCLVSSLSSAAARALRCSGVSSCGGVVVCWAVEAGGVVCCGSEGCRGTEGVRIAGGGKLGVGASGKVTGLSAVATYCWARRGAARVRLAKTAEITKNDAVCFDTMMSLPSLYFPIDGRADSVVEARKVGMEGIDGGTIKAWNGERARALC